MVQVNKNNLLTLLSGLLGGDGYIKRASGVVTPATTIPYADLSSDVRAGADKVSDPLAAGFCSVSRILAANANTVVSGSLRLSYFTAPQTVALSNITVCTSSTAAAATPTLIRFGVFSVASNGDLTLIGSTPNDTTLLAAGFTAYTKAFTTPASFVAGQRYAWAPLVVTVAAMPTFIGSSGSVAAEWGVSPRWNGALGSQTDLPSSIATGSVALSGLGLLYARFS